jgi:uncharacterized 2Fe-2S/4Fe-4S cluster protein (DUF4445 family)
MTRLSDTVSVVLQPEGRRLRMRRGVTLLEGTQEAGVDLLATCGGVATCGRCRVRVLTRGVPVTSADARFFDQEELASGWRLACQLHVDRHLLVTIPEGTRAFDQKILEAGIAANVPLEPAVRRFRVQLPAPTLTDLASDLERLDAGLKGAGAESVTVPHALLQSLPQTLRAGEFHASATVVDGQLVELIPGEVSTAPHGVAVDIGTTTIVGMLLDLETGEELAVASATNPQVAYGDDVVSRINHARTHPDGLRTLQQAVVGCLNDIIGQLCRRARVRRRDIYEVVVVGNTTMAHLLLGVNPEFIAQAPYVGAWRSARTVGAREVGLRLHPRGQLTILPNIAGFVGSDTVGVILATRLLESERVELAIDIGTNGEIVLGSRGRLLCCSTAAGPAFEGARIRFGMRAAAGAIERVTFAEDVHCEVIGARSPLGMCGTGLIDAVAELLRVGVVDAGGRLRPPEEVGEVPEPIRRRVRRHSDGLIFLLVGREEGAPEDIYLTQRDVREVQLAKGALFAGIRTLERELGISDADISRVLLAGAFGNYIRRDMALRIGLLPALPVERVEFVGNSAGTGAKMALLSTGARSAAERISRTVEYVELAASADFQDTFAEAMLFPLG